MSSMSRRGILAGTVAAVAGTAIPRRALASTADAADQSAVVVQPDDPRYADLVVGNNARWVGQPDSVHLVNNADQVVQAVQEAVSGNKRISVRGGGHCYADFVYNPDVQVVIDTSNLNAVSYDAEHNAFAVGAGAILLEAYEGLFKNWGVTIPGGMCYSVGMGGHISGGGYGLLSRRHGLTIDHLYAVEVVVVDSNGTARTVVATREPNDPNHDLWWAHTGGGGGNFGIVTRFLFRSPGATGSDPAGQLMHPPNEVLVSALSLPWSDLTEDRYTAMVRAFGSWHAKNTSPDASSAGLCSFLMMNHKSNESIGMLTQIDASVPNAEDVINEFLREVISGTGVEARPMTRPAGELGPMADFFTPRRLPWLHSAKLLGTSNPTLTSPVLRGAHKSAYLRKEFADAQIAAMYRNLTRTDFQNPASMVVLLSYGGKINDISPGDTASVQRDSIFKGLFQSFWEDKSGDTDNIGWTRDVFGEVFSASGGYPVPNEVTDGCYINYPDVDITDPNQNKSGVPWFTLYYGDNYPRLQRIKAAYDPRNIFRHSQSITLP